MEEKSPGKSEVLEQLSRILRSQVFRNSDMLCNFISFIVQETLKDDGMVLKQYSIAIHAFGRSDDFDSTADPIVRIQASRLRRNLQLYYQEEGVDDPVIINLPKGSYVPNFEYFSEQNKDVNVQEVAIRQANSLAFFPIKNLSSNHENQHIVDGFNEELLFELSRFKDLEVVRLKEGLNDLVKNSISRFSLEGSVRFTGDKLKITIIVTDNFNSQVIWSFQEKYDGGDYDIIQIQEDVAKSVAQQIASINGVIFEKLFLDSNWQNTRDPEAYTVYVHFYQYNKKPTEKNANYLLTELEKIIETRQDFGPAWAVLTNLYADAYMFGLDRQFIEKALECGRKAVELQPRNQVCQTYLSYALMLNNELDEAKKHFNIALELNPNANYYTGAIGWAYCMVNEFEKGFYLIHRSMDLDYQYPTWFHMGTFLYYLDRQEYNKALIEANKVEVPDLYWQPLIRLVASERLNLNDQALVNLDELSEIKPDFFDHPDEYVRVLIKSDKLSEVILDSFKAIFQLSEISLGRDVLR